MWTFLRSWLCLCCPKTMGMKKVLPCLLLSIVILTLVVSLPFVQCSSSTRIYRLTNMAAAGSKPIETNIEVARFGNEAPSVVGTVEDSARKVPTGPDPLHHNNNPIGP